jgi:hypothetical protein
MKDQLAGASVLVQFGEFHLGIDILSPRYEEICEGRVHLPQAVHYQRSADFSAFGAGVRVASGKSAATFSWPIFS